MTELTLMRHGIAEPFAGSDANRSRPAHGLTAGLFDESGAHGSDHDESGHADDQTGEDHPTNDDH